MGRRRRLGVVVGLRHRGRGRGFDAGSVHRITAISRNETALSDEREADVAVDEQQAGDPGPDDPGEVVERRPGAVGRTELALVADEARQQGADRGVEERREAGGEHRDHRDRPQRPVHRDEDGQHDHARGAREIRGEEHVPPVEAVRDDPGRDAQEDVREHPDGADDAEDDRVLGLAVDEDDERDEVQPVADGRHELADEQPRQRAVPQQLAVGSQDVHRGDTSG